MTPEERIATGEQAKVALSRFLAPAFDHVMTDYHRRMTEIAAETPWETGRIAKLAAAFKIAKTVREQIELLAKDGDMARQDIRHAAQIEGLSVERKKLLGIALPHG